MGEEEKILNRNMSELKAILEALLEEAKLDTLFTASLDIDRMYTALREADFLGTLDIILYDELAPFPASSTQRITVPDGFYYLQWEVFIEVSIPWYMHGIINYYGFPPMVDPSVPPRYEGRAVGYWPLRNWVEFTGTNLHATENNRYHVVFRVAVISTDTWNMIKAVFLDPITAYLMKQAKELSGVPL